MGYRMALSFKNNKRDNDLLEVINSKRDKSNFIKDAIEFFIKYENVMFAKQPNFVGVDINNKIEDFDKEEEKEIEIEKVNINAALTFMSKDD